MGRVAYALGVLAARWRGDLDRTCPYCAAPGRCVGRKWGILSLYQCDACGLRFRVPKDRPAAAWRFYQRAYAEPTATAVPTAAELADESPQRFRRFLKDRTEFLAQAVAFGPPRCALDYGCSWGYAVDWLARQGVPEVLGYEISRPRADFGREQLGLAITSDIDALLATHAGKIDLLYTAHVLEHLPSLAGVLERFFVLLSPGGRLAVAVPNASDPALAARAGVRWAHLVGEVHPLALSYAFLERALARCGFGVLFRGAPEAVELRLVAQRPSSA